MQKLRSRPRVVKSVASGHLARSRQTAGRRSVSKIGAVLGRRDRTKATFQLGDGVSGSTTAGSHRTTRADLEQRWRDVEHTIAKISRKRR